MSRKLSVNLFSADSIQECVNELSFISNYLDVVCDESISKLAKDVKDEASLGYTAQESMVNVPAKAGATPPGADWDVQISPISQTSVKVRAIGQDVPFMEFGAGIHFNGPAGSSPHPLGAEYGAVIGEYGKKHGRNDSWLSPSGETFGTPYSASMYNAYVKALDTAKETVEKELNKLI